MSNKKYYQTIFFVLLQLLALDVDCEVRTEVGRIDAVVKTAERIFVFEFKLQGTAEDALQQIHQRRYHEKYTATAANHSWSAPPSTPKPATSTAGWSSEGSAPQPTQSPAILAHWRA